MSVVSRDEPIARTTRGMVRGRAVDGGWLFAGVPFAAAPVGPLRFAPPAPVEQWDGMRTCTEPGPWCPQEISEVPPHWAAFASVSGPVDEDCLYLDVLTPGIDGDPRPTMVWIHGGGFRGGSGAAHPVLNGSFLADGIVLVTLNYRLGPLGFLYLDDDFPGAAETGNLAMLDQLAGLRWVRENIAAFGGDPDNVTVFGESAGGTSVAMLLAMPSATGMFHGTIAQSAAYVSVSPTQARAATREILRQVDVGPGDWAALRAVPSGRLVAAANTLAHLPGPDDVGLAPVVGTGLIHDFPSRSREQRTTVPVIVGTTRDEWLGVWGVAPPGALPPPNLSAPFRADGVDDDDAIRRAYGARGFHRDAALYGAFDTDRLFRQYTIALCDGLADAGSQVWAYRVDWAPSLAHGDVGASTASTWHWSSRRSTTSAPSVSTHPTTWRGRCTRHGSTWLDTATPTVLG